LSPSFFDLLPSPALVSPCYHIPHTEPLYTEHKASLSYLVPTTQLRFSQNLKTPVEMAFNWMLPVRIFQALLAILVLALTAFGAQSHYSLPPIHTN
jgi:hypothetical protein